MKIVYLNPVGALGGAERVLLAVMGSVRQVLPTAQLHLIACTDGPLLERAAELGVHPVLLPMPENLTRLGDSQHREQRGVGRAWGLLRQAVTAGLGTWRYARRLRSVLRELAPDVIHSNGIKTHLLTRLAGQRISPIVWHVHDFYGERPLVRRLLRWAHKGTAGAIAISQAIATDLQKLVPELPAQVIYNRINVDAFSPSYQDEYLLDRLSGMPAAPAETIRIGLVATYARWKGQDVFLNAAASILKKQGKRLVRFYIIGGPIYHTQGSQFSVAELQERAASLGVSSDVAFIDFQQDAAPIYRALDIMVHASTRPEPFGLTIVEAMACGKPVVAARAGGAAELFTHGHDAIGVVPGDAELLATALMELMADPQRRWQLGDNARRTAIRRFDQDGLGQHILDVYRAVLHLPPLTSPLTPQPPLPQRGEGEQECPTPPRPLVAEGVGG